MVSNRVFERFMILQLLFVQGVWMRQASESERGNVNGQQSGRSCASETREKIYRDNSGARIPSYTTSMTCGKYGPITLMDTTLLSTMAHFNRERIPERMAHALGTGAFGYFEVTNDISRYSKASVFSRVGSRIDIAARFSLAFPSIGALDLSRDIRGIAVKFYTDDGNWDLTCLTSTAFVVRDPLLFPAIGHAGKVNPRTNRPDPNALPDIISREHQGLFTFLQLLSPLGLPDGYRRMNGHAIHTFVLVNAKNKPVYCKFHLLTDQGVKNLTNEEAAQIASRNPNYSAQDLYEAIERGERPSWSLKIQVMTFEQAAKFRYNVFDPTKVWPEREFPLVPVGRIVLTRNPEIHFDEVEQMTLSPGNLVPGIEPSMDRVLQARIFSYPDAQRYRLGPNSHHIPVNRPRPCPVNLENSGTSHIVNTLDNYNNYYPSSNTQFRPDPTADHMRYTINGSIARHEIGDEDNYSQPREWYESLSEFDKNILVENLLLTLNGCTESVKLRLMAALERVSRELTERILWGSRPSGAQ